MNCGEGRLARPSMGSWVTYGLGSENENLPAYVSLCPGGMPIKRAENWRSSFLPGRFQGTYLDSSIQQVEDMIENLRNTQVRDARQAKQLDFLRQVNEQHLREQQHHQIITLRMEEQVAVSNRKIKIFNISPNEPNWKSVRLFCY